MKQPVTPVTMVWQRHCTWPDSVLLNVSAVRLNEAARPLCLGSISASCTGDFSVRFTSKMANFCWHTALLKKKLTECSPRHENALLAKINSIWHQYLRSSSSSLLTVLCFLDQRFGFYISCCVNTHVTPQKSVIQTLRLCVAFVCFLSGAVSFGVKGT